MRAAWALMPFSFVSAIGVACSGSAPSDDGTPPSPEAGVSPPPPPQPAPAPQPFEAGTPGALLFAQSYGGADEEFEDGVAIDPSNGVAMVGSMKSSFDFGKGMLTNAGGPDAFIAHFDKNGATLGSKSFGDSLDQFGTQVAVNGSGDMFMLVLYHGTVDFGGAQDVANGDGAFDLSLVRLRSDLSFATRTYLGGAGPQNGFAVAADPAAGATVFGQNGGVMNVAGQMLTATGTNDAFIAHTLSSQDWSRQLVDAPPGMHAQAVAYDAAGNAYVAGSFVGSMDFGGGQVTSTGGQDAFVSKIAANGTHIKTLRMGGAADDLAWRIATDKSGRIVVAGSFTGSATLGNVTLTSKGAKDVFVITLDASLTPVSTLSFGGAADDEPTGLALDASGSIVITGNTYGTIDFGGGPLTSAGGADIFAAKLRSDGAHIWSRLVGDAGDQRSFYGAAVATTGEIWVTGHFTGTVDVGGKTLTSAGLHDVFLAKYAP